jgi:predicted transcriptional regulator
VINPSLVLRQSGLAINLKDFKHPCGSIKQMLRIMRIAVILIAFSAITGIVVASDGVHDIIGDHGKDTTFSQASGPLLKVLEDSGHYNDSLSLSRESGPNGGSASGKDSSDKFSDPASNKTRTTGSSSDGGTKGNSTSIHGGDKDTSQEDQKGVTSDVRVQTAKVTEKGVPGNFSDRDSGLKGGSASGKDSSDKSSDPVANKMRMTGSSSDGGTKGNTTSIHGGDKDTSPEDQRGVRSSDDRVQTTKVTEQVSGERSDKNSGVREVQNHGSEPREKLMTVYKVPESLSKKDIGNRELKKWDWEMSKTLASPAPNPDSAKQEKSEAKSPVDHYPVGETPIAIPAAPAIPVIPATPAIPCASGGLPLESAAPAPRGMSPLALRNKMKGEQNPFWNKTDSSFILGPFMLLKIWFFLGFRRIERKNVLDHDERNYLYQNIEEHPGVDLTRLVQMLGLNKETARYHIKMLSLNGKISGLIKQGIARYFPTRQDISEYEKTVIHYLWIGTTKRILLLLLDSPGLTRQAIAENLGISGPSVTWQMQRLAEDGLVEIRSVGKFVMYFLTKDGVETLQSVKNKHSDGIVS